MVDRHWEFLPADEKQVSLVGQHALLPEGIARTLVARGWVDPHKIDLFLSKSIEGLSSPIRIKGMADAVERLQKAVEQSETVVVHGDYDADGITAAAMLTLFLEDIGIRAIPFVPNRLKESHGISLRAIELAQKEGARLIVTCDCGISSAEEVAALREAGIETIVTDHHAIPESLPVSAILVDPKLADEESEEAELAGVGVVFMLSIALRAKLREEGFFTTHPEPNLKNYLDIVALGTLADMAPLRGPNRILVAHGLRQLLETKRPGLIAMRMKSGLGEADVLTEEDVGFRLAPRINAAARLGHAEEALQVLLTAEKRVAEDLAEQLNRWNDERKGIQNRMVRSALDAAAGQVAEGRKTIVVAGEEFHPGVAGLVAQRLAEETGFPSFVFAVQGEWAKGSARSRHGIHVLEALQSCSKVLESFGGHREAAGCVLRASHLAEFKRLLEEASAAQQNYASRKIAIDAKQNFRQLNEGFLASLSRLRPFGMGNPEPLFWTRAHVVGQAREVGEGHLQVSLQDEAGGSVFRAIGFGLWRSLGGIMRGKVEVVYSPTLNEWNGKRQIQIRLCDARPS